jgi:hypothetical protein
MTRTRQAVLMLALAVAPVLVGIAQEPAKVDQPTLSRELQLERENLLLTARINELETQLAQIKSQLINDRISKAAPTLIQKLQAAAPEWDINPNTLEFTKKQTAALPTPNGTPVATPRP